MSSLFEGAASNHGESVHLQLTPTRVNWDVQDLEGQQRIADSCPNEACRGMDLLGAASLGPYSTELFAAPSQKWSALGSMVGMQLWTGLADSIQK
eukprot:5983314-Pyramimonas_sp.AAC.1